jgi:histidyl-tRNA synthetase
MAIQKSTIPKGTRDFGPADVQKRKYILNTIETVFKKYGFMPIETPTMENLSTLEGKYGDEGDKLLFRILNSGETWEQVKNPKSEIQTQGDFNKVVTEKGLRYDLTVPFARYVVMNKNEITFPFKRYQMQPVWRADRPQKGRYREFWQCDADVVGSDSLLNELDLIQIYDEAFRKLRITDYELRINNRKILAGIAEVVKSVEMMSVIAVAIDKLDKIGEDGVRRELSEQGFTADELNRLFEIILIKGENVTILNQLKSKLATSAEGTKGIEELEFILTALISINRSGNQAINLKLDFSLARGLSYYTGCIFEVVSTEGTLKSSIGGGGRYDNLTGIFGLPNVSGVGISFGLDRIYDVIEELKLFPEGLNATSTKVLVCAFEKATLTNGIAIVKQLRDANIASELYPDLPKSNKEKEKPMLKPLGYADALNIPFTLILKEGKMILKDMKAKTETELSIEQIISNIQSI